MMTENQEEIDTVDDHNLICPYCGEKHDEPWEYFSNNDETADVICDECDRDFVAIRHISVSYQTVKKGKPQ